MVKRDGMGQGNVCSTGNFTVTSSAALESLRHDTQNLAVMPAFIDDLTAVTDAQYAVDLFDEAVKAQKDGMGCANNMSKTKAILPTPENADDVRVLEAVRRQLLLRGFDAANIIDGDTPAPERGLKLLGAPIGTAEFAEALLRKRAATVAVNGTKISEMGLAYPHEALQLTTSSLSKRLDYAARQNDPSPEALDALGTADELTLAVLGRICGEQADPSSPADVVQLPAFASALAAMAPSWGGLGIRPLRRLAESGILHIASLNQSLPRLLDRLTASPGHLAATLAAEIRAVDTSTLAWAVTARAAYARLCAAVGLPMSPADTKLLKKLLDGVDNIGKAVDIPPLLSLVTVVSNGFQQRSSQALWQRDFALLLSQVDDYQTFLLRSGCAKGATAHLQPINLDPFAPSHRAAADRMQPHIFRMSLRYVLGLEPIPGFSAAVLATGGLCPSCNASMVGYEPHWITNHAVSCAVGGWTQRTARALTGAICRNLLDAGVPSQRETAGLSATSAHRPGDVVTGSMSVPVSFDAGGEHRYVVDTTMVYVSRTNVASIVRGDPATEVTNAEAAKLRQIRNEVNNGTRSALAPGYKFMPAAMDPRGRSGPSMLQLHEWIAEHAAMNRNTASADDAAELGSKLVTRFTARVSMAMHRSVMLALHDRWQRVLRRAGRDSGQSAVSALELRFQGGGGTL